jgi:hypothetical protein
MAGVGEFEWSPDGTRIAYLAPDPPSDSQKKTEEETAGVQVIDGSPRGATATSGS